MSPRPEVSAYSDAALIELIKQYQLYALEALYDRYAGIVYSLVINITREVNTAEAILHEIFWQIWCEPSALRDEENLLAYFCRVARRTSLQQLRLRHGQALPATKIV